MFKEISLKEQDRDLHWFLLENSECQIQDWRIKHATLGITSSPFLASSVLLQIATDYVDQFPQVARVVQNLFYMDDCQSGASTVEEAAQLKSDLNTMLLLGCLTLQKW